MGRLDAKNDFDPNQKRKFEKELLADLQALERMEVESLFEDDITRIGAEQEMFLVDEAGLPALTAVEILKAVKDPEFTTELGLFNLELNLNPLEFTASCFSELEKEIHRKLAILSKTAATFHTEIVLTGILPTLAKRHFSLSNMTPVPRYAMLNEQVTRLRGVDEYEILIQGTDELYLKHDSVMLEAANTSFQVHLQVAPQEFAKYYNCAQAIAAPVLASCVNSPLFLGKRLWHESRIALFQRSLDTRTHQMLHRRSSPRVSFGTRWVNDSVTELFREDIALFRVMMGVDNNEDPLKCLDAGKVPRLNALQFHNSTVYRWNRPCYGRSKDKPHLRIENRYIPSGPTVVDEVANAVFWIGLLKGIVAEINDIRDYFEFDDVQTNFTAAARRGLDAQLKWTKKHVVPARELILKDLLPLARKGLQQHCITQTDSEKYLGIVEERIKKRATGASWQLQSVENLQFCGSKQQKLCALVEGMKKNQRENIPVHKWKNATLRSKGDLRRHYATIEHFMSTEIFTIGEEDIVELVVEIMHWQKIRHIPVENNKHELLGMVDYRALINLISRIPAEPDILTKPVSSIMQKDVLTAAPDTETATAIRLMLENDVRCLPVVQDNCLVGVITEHDFLQISGQVFNI